MPSIIDRTVDRIDHVQRRHRVLAFPFAVFKRYGEDHGGWVGALGSLGVARVLQDAVNTVWGVARFRRPGFLPKLARSLAIVTLLGVGLIATGAVAGLTITAQFPVIGLALVAVVNIALAGAITLAVYRLSLAQRGRQPLRAALRVRDGGERRAGEALVAAIAHREVAR